MAQIRIDRCGVAEQPWLPLVGVASHEAIEVLKTHADRPLVEGPGLTRLIDGCIVVLTFPCGTVSVLQKDAAYGGAVLADDAVVARKAAGDLGDHAEANRVVVASCNQGRTCWRAQCRRVEVGIAQSVGGDTVQGGRNNSTECGGCSKADIVGHDEQDVGRSLCGHYASRPCLLRLVEVKADDTWKRLRRRRQIASVDGCRRAGRTRRACGLLCQCQLER